MAAKGGTSNVGTPYDTSEWHAKKEAHIGTKEVLPKYAVATKAIAAGATLTIAKTAISHRL